MLDFDPSFVWEVVSCVVYFHLQINVTYANSGLLQPYLKIKSPSSSSTLIWLICSCVSLDELWQYNYVICTMICMHIYKPVIFVIFYLAISWAYYAQKLTDYSYLHFPLFLIYSYMYISSHNYYSFVNDNDIHNAYGNYHSY